jgi:catechol 2,3-dioxygenase-like lactoylglutathione lyase family enzyme
MTRPFHTPVPVFDPAKGLLANDHFQMGYVTNDIERAVAVFRSRFGVQTFRASDNETPGGGKVSVRAVWIGRMMYELACGSGPGMEDFSDYAPPGGDFVLKFHHFGYLIPDEAAWSAMEAVVAHGGWTMRKPSDTPGFVRACFVDVPELGHLIEFIMPREGMIERFNATPVA